ncbi:MAG: AraC family transcriptional regulator [Dorea sp.]|nr:AraC family transcriptional regulator [Dorea sp.]
MQQKKFQSIILKQELNITNIYSIHYFEYSHDFVFEGESHDFWELLFVDSGVIEVTAGEKKVRLENGDIIFHKPNEFHALRTYGKSAPNLIVISFDCNAPCMSFFENKVLRANEVETQYLSQIISEARKTFCTPLNHPYISNLRRYANTPFGSEQMIKASLELLLLSMLRRCAHSAEVQRFTTAAVPYARRNNEKVVEQVTQYLLNHIYDNLTVANICRDNTISRSQLQQLFHQYKGCGVIEFFSRLKIDTAKQLIREGQYTFSQIANILNYSSYQYFSLQFKKYTRMSPSEYSMSTQYYNKQNEE